LGLSAALKDPSYDALFSEYGRKHLALAWGEWEAMDYFTASAGALIGGIVVVQYGFQTLLYIMLICSIVSFVISLLLLQHKRRTHARI
jgi:predicted MFS family arabinose efflux permease